MQGCGVGGGRRHNVSGPWKPACYLVLHTTNRWATVGHAVAEQEAAGTKPLQPPLVLQGYIWSVPDSWCVCVCVCVRACVCVTGTTAGVPAVLLLLWVVDLGGVVTQLFTVSPPMSSSGRWWGSAWLHRRGWGGGCPPPTPREA